MISNMSEFQVLDATAEPRDEIEIEVQTSIVDPDHRTIYIHVNGITLVRIGHVFGKNLQVHLRPKVKK